MNIDTLEEVGNLCESIYLDMMVIRDEGMLPLCNIPLGGPEVAASYIEHPATVPSEQAFQYPCAIADSKTSQLIYL